jgi:putative hemolysin
VLSNLIIIAVLLLFWAFFAGTETAFIATNRFRLNNLRKRGKNNALIASFLLEKPDRLLTTTLVGTNFCLVMTANMTSVLFAQVMGRPVPLLSIAVLTFSSLVICEILPKNIGIRHSLRLTLLFSYPLYVFYFIFYPIGKIFSFVSQVIIRIVDVSHTGYMPHLFSKKDDVKIFLTSQLKRSAIKGESRYFVETMDFGEKKLSDVMVPLVEVHAIPVQGRVEACHDFVRENQKYYIPIYEKRIFNIVGVVYISDLFDADRSLRIRQIMREPYFVPENKKINELYRELYERDVPVFFAVDEFGGVTGMGTIYDIGEEVIGEINVASEKQSVFIKINEREYLCSGDLEIDEINHRLGVDIDSTDFTTLNGLMISMLGRIPKNGDHIETEGFRFIVEKSSKKRTELIRIKA